MAYNDDHVWLYEHDIPNGGDPTRVALETLLRDIESFLFDYNHPGYAKSEFLSWALQRADATKNSSGNAPDAVLFWHPEAPGLNYNRPKKGAHAPGRVEDLRIGGLPRPDFLQGSDRGGEDELYPTEPRFQPVPDPNLARVANRNAYVVNPRTPDEPSHDKDGED